jgi:hypothetical protein
MVRGTQKQVIHLKSPESPLFEEAIFVIKHMPHTPPTQRTMVEEANRLLAGEGVCEVPAQVGERMQTPAPLLLFLGALCGAAFTALVCLLL